MRASPYKETKGPSWSGESGDMGGYKGWWGVGEYTQCKIYTYMKMFFGNTACTIYLHTKT